ncbi:MAG TPA: branched-chain amino acid ABC transporter permease [Phycisphaerae bacterium]|jgi:branched-chain amino acid transport system permease protein
MSAGQWLEWFIRQTISGLTLGGVYALIALGYSLVYGVLRLINFAHGDVYMVGAVVAFWAARRLGWSQSANDLVSPQVTLAMLFIAILACVLLGYVIERFAYRPLRKAPRLNSLITAIGVSFLLENIFQLQAVFGASPRGFPETRLPISVVKIGGYDLRFEQFLILGGTVFFLMVCRYVILHTRVGLGIRATSFHHDYARLMGVNVNRITSLTFVIGSALAAIAGVFVGMYQHQCDPLMGVNYGLKAFTAAVVGGIGNLAGAVLGGFIMGLSETYIAGSRFSDYRDAFAFVLLILILLVRPGGLLGSVAPEKV